LPVAGVLLNVAALNEPLEIQPSPQVAVPRVAVVPLTVVVP